MRQKLTRAFIRLLGPALLALVLLRMPHPGDILRAVYHASLLPLALAVLLNVVNIHLKVIRWRILLETRGIRYPMRRAWAAFLASLYAGMLTPGRVGDLLRVQYLHHDLDQPYSEGLASVVMDRLCDIYVLVAFVAVGIVRYGAVLTGRLAYATWAGVVATAVLPLLLLVPGVAERLGRGVYARLAHGDTRGLSRFLAALRANVGPPLLRTLPLTVVTFLVNYIQGWLIARSLGLSISLFDATCLLAIANLLGLLPISVSGVGVREFYFSLVFPQLGLTPANGVSFGLLVFVVIYLVTVLAGFVCWELFPPPAPESLEREREVVAPSAE